MSELITEMIDIEKIHHHPENPRKDLGDLSELTESIKKNGIMQNLTVIPGYIEKGKKKKNGYTLLIGHRRFEAAKAAGLEEVPCRIIDDLTDKEQISIMLEENIQRNDLTTWEQANGFQMMLDLGDTVDTLAERTGFSKTTIYHRVNIAKLDMELVKEREEDPSFQLTLNNLYELEKIKDIDIRNKILKEATKSEEISWKVNRALQEQMKQETIDAFRAKCEALGLAEGDKDLNDNWYSHRNKTHKELFCKDTYGLKPDLEIPDDVIAQIDDTCIYLISSYYIRIAKPMDEMEEEEDETSAAEKERKAKRDDLVHRINQTCFDIQKNIKDFGERIAAGKCVLAKKDADDAIRGLYDVMVENAVTIEREAYDPYIENIDDLEDEEEYESVISDFRDGLSLSADLALQLINSSSTGYRTLNWRDAYEPQRHIERIVAALKPFGFSITDEEQAVLEGTSNLYKELDELKEEEE